MPPARRALALLLPVLAVTALSISASGCGSWVRSISRVDDAPVFEDGALRSFEPHSLEAVDDACAVAVETLGYGSLESNREPESARWRALTAGGDPVDIELLARGRERTAITIRVGAYGDEARSRLVLEQIRLSL